VISGHDLISYAMIPRRCESSAWWHPTGPFSSDDDMLGDGFELANGLDPLNGDEDGNGARDQHDDFDGDGLTDKHEFGSCRPVGIRPDGRLSQRPHERVVVGMRSDPKPRDRVIVNQAKRPPADPDSDGPHASRTYLPVEPICLNARLGCLGSSSQSR
jgi:hypothetical protein